MPPACSRSAATRGRRSPIWPTRSACRSRRSTTTSTPRRISSGRSPARGPRRSTPRSTASRRTRRRPSGSASRCARTSPSSPASSTSRPCSCASGATWAASGASAFVAERRRYEERVRELFRDGVERSELRTDLDVADGRAPLPLGGELGVHLAAAGRRHRRARRPDLRRAARRHARLRDSRKREAAARPPAVVFRLFQAALTSLGRRTRSGGRSRARGATDGRSSRARSPSRSCRHTAGTRASALIAAAIRSANGSRRRGREERARRRRSALMLCGARRRRQRDAPAGTQSTSR